MSKVLVTGATGFIGSHLVEALIEKNYEVYCLVRHRSRLRFISGLPVNIVEGDCEQRLELPEVDAVFHLAGRIKACRAKEFYQTNVQGTINLLKCVLRQSRPLKRFIFVSTLAVHGRLYDTKIRPQDPPYPLSHYAKSKWLAEQAVLSLKDKFPVIILRPTAIYGPKDREVLNYLKLVKSGLAPVLNSKGLLSFCYVKDLVNVLMLSLEKELPSGTCLLVSDGKSYTWQQAISIIAHYLNKRPILLKIPKNMAILVAIMAQTIGRLLSRPLIFSVDKLKEVFQKSWFCDISETCRILGYKPHYDLESGMKETIRWYQKQGWL